MSTKELESIIEQLEAEVMALRLRLDSHSIYRAQIEDGTEMLKVWTGRFAFFMNVVVLTGFFLSGRLTWVIALSYTVLAWAFWYFGSYVVAEFIVSRFVLSNDPEFETQRQHAANWQVLQVDEHADKVAIANIPVVEMTDSEYLKSQVSRVIDAARNGKLAFVSESSIARFVDPKSVGKVMDTLNKKGLLESSDRGKRFTEEASKVMGIPYPMRRDVVAMSA